jgi:hypothetical protein
MKITIDTDEQSYSAAVAMITEIYRASGKAVPSSEETARRTGETGGEYGWREVALRHWVLSNSDSDALAALWMICTNSEEFIPLSDISEFLAPDANPQDRSARGRRALAALQRHAREMGSIDGRLPLDVSGEGEPSYRARRPVAELVLAAIARNSNYDLLVSEYGLPERPHHG